MQRHRALHLPSTPQSVLIISYISHSTYLGKWCPQCGFHAQAEHTGSMEKDMYLKLSLKAGKSYFNKKWAANKALVAALSCGKQLLRDFTGILTEG